ncbi:hypothetical protein AUC43_02770 [Hymenobacter sedentarius]|uniref:Uncharacterized protein n=1 Tax=Hymenobacter sedentarius TaxID=1411621 RepID=A0A0U4BV12_9BACT|nr:hypothetical protein AUC43_02770 [Hymenobacter sedentarius]
MEFDRCYNNCNEKYYNMSLPKVIQVQRLLVLKEHKSKNIKYSNTRRPQMLLLQRQQKHSGPMEAR